MSDVGSLNLRWAAALLDGLAAAGVRRVMLSPGSRSTPLALAALRHPCLETRVVVDERAAAFMALGAAKAEAAPAVVIATSGSAVANWHPAVVEADMARVPLILLSADRPPELQACGANQTIDQVKPFGSHVRAFHALPPAEAETAWLAAAATRMVGDSLWPLAGPVHVNVPLREPLLPADPARVPLAAGAWVADGRPLVGTLAPTAEQTDLLAGRLSGRSGIIVCGTEDLGQRFHGAVIALARSLHCPILADPLSGLRHLDVITRADAFLRRGDAMAARPEWILRFGGAPVAKHVGTYLRRHADAWQAVVCPHPRWADPERTAATVVHADPAVLCESLRGLQPGPAAWEARFTAWEGLGGDLPEEGRLARGLAQALPEGAALFLGNSLTVRQFDWFMGRSARPLALFGNRGASGIDGNVATFLGIAGLRRPAVAVMGDLTFLHDMTALQAANGVAGAVVVVNNGGGGIFDHLPAATLDEYAVGWLTPHQVDIGQAAALFGLRHHRTGDGAEAAARAVAAAAGPGLTVIELAVDRNDSLERHRAHWRAVGEARMEEE